MPPVRRTVLTASPPRLLPLLALLVSTALLAVPASAGTGASDDLRRKIVWESDSAHALFLPQEALDTVRLDDLPLPEWTKREIERRIESVRAAADRRALPIEEVVERHLGDDDAGYPPETVAWMRRKLEDLERTLRGHYERYGPCRLVSRRSCGAASSEPLEILQARQDLAFVAQVVETVPGWSLRAGQEVTMVYLRIEEIARDREGHLHLGQIVGLEERRGTVEIAGVPLCTAPEQAETRSEVGDLVLIHGGQERHDDVYVQILTIEPLDQPATNGDP